MSVKKGKSEFIEYFKRNMCCVSDACSKFGISRATFYLWINDDEQFKEDVEAARAEMRDKSENTLQRLAMGIPKLDDKGNFIGWEVKPDTVALIFLKKADDPDKYGDKATHTVNLNSDAPFVINISCNGTAKPDEHK